MGRLDGKIAIVTGGGTGIGRAIAVLFAREGARVVAAGRREGPLAETAERVREARGQVRVVAADASTPEGCEEIVNAAREAFGEVNVLVNNAGIFDARARVHETSVEDWDRMIAVNLRGPFLMTRAVVPGMLAAGGGSIVNIGSILAQVAIPNAAAYNASKAGMLMLTRSTAMDLAAEKIRCNMVCPGLVETSMTEGVWRQSDIARAVLRDYPMGRFGRPEEIAMAALHFASDESAWTTGAALMVDGGATAH